MNNKIMVRRNIQRSAVYTNSTSAEEAFQLIWKWNFRLLKKNETLDYIHLANTLIPAVILQFT